MHSDTDTQTDTQSDAQIDAQSGTQSDTQSDTQALSPALSRDGEREKQAGNPMSRWYIIHAYSGFENKVRESILAEAGRMGLASQVEAVEVPTEKVTEIRRGKKVTNDRKFFPGYVLAKLTMGDQVYHLVKNTPKVTGFLGPNGKPQAISEAEAARILSTKEEAASAAPKQKISVDYEIGDSVKVLDGPFASFNGIVEELDFDRGRVKVSVSIFGRATPVELEFEQVERVK
jgi:transcriptional antiterminator NusG